MALADIDELDLWRGEAIAERSFRLHAAAIGGGAVLDTTGDRPVGSKQKSPEEQRLSDKWHGADVSVSHGPWKEGSDRRTRSTKVRIGWRGANKPKG